MKCIHPEPRAYCKRSDGCRDCDEDSNSASSPGCIAKPFRIGSFNLYQDGDGGIWIGDGTGEGGRFSEKKLSMVIDRFYRENF